MHCAEPRAAPSRPAVTTVTTACRLALAVLTLCALSRNQPATSEQCAAQLAVVLVCARLTATTVNHLASAVLSSSAVLSFCALVEPAGRQLAVRRTAAVLVCAPDAPTSHAKSASFRVGHTRVSRESTRVSRPSACCYRRNHEIGRCATAVLARRQRIDWRPAAALFELALFVSAIQSFCSFLHNGNA